MQLKINKKSGFPIRYQLKEQIKFLIETGQLKPHAKLPTIRELAAYLRINQNTVLQALRELEEEGFLLCERGKGCFIKEGCCSISEVNMQKLTDILEEVIEKAKSLGISYEEFASVACHKLELNQSLKKRRPKIYFLECNKPELEYRTIELERKLGVELKPMLIDEFKILAEKEKNSLGEPIDLVLTTFGHLREVKKILEGRNIETIGLMAALHIKTLIEISKLPQGSEVAMVCVNPKSAKNVERAVINTGLRNIIPCAVSTNNLKKLEEVLEDVDAIVSSRGALDKIKQVASEGKKIIVFDRVIDMGSIELAKEAIEEIK